MLGAGGAEAVAEEKRLAKRVAVLPPPPLLLLVLAVLLPLFAFTATGGGMYCSIPAELSGSTEFEKRELSYMQN